MSASASVTRFAPSPTGLLHLGHAYSAFFASAAAGPDGRFLLRIEDIDQGRSRPAFEAAILEDLGWLGLAWETPVRRQSAHMAEYGAALSRLERDGLLYPCFCTRADIQREIAEAAAAPHLVKMGPDGPVYPGTCRHLTKAEQQQRMDSGTPYALRLKTHEAMAAAGPLTWHDEERGTFEAAPDVFGDVVLARKDVPASYHLACTWDDALQGITLVTRGEDLLAATHIHRLLQALWKLPVPRYRHHRLIADAGGKKFSKRDHAPTLRALRESGATPERVKGMLGS
ncbi:MAG: tRNA glutamyl-Q(34) synthetase GluQRS [Rhodospirillaceae bacterium]|nr:tRNA glutamyl-Q(34) synthetase GluQRS [Rhodospirillaceae bacterium]